MGDFNIIYKILAALKVSMDYDEFDSRLILAERLNVSEPRRCELLRILSQAGYITSVAVDERAAGDVMMSSRSRKGAWIEISRSTPPRRYLQSRSRRGAWIEICALWPVCWLSFGRSRKGAWIEIL